MKLYEIHYKTKSDKDVVQVYEIKEATEVGRAEEEFKLFCLERDLDLEEAYLSCKTLIVKEETLKTYKA